jgi:hypothetical protein
MRLSKIQTDFNSLPFDNYAIIYNKFHYSISVCYDFASICFTAQCDNILFR